MPVSRRHIIADGLRCRRSDGKRWRCTNSCTDGDIYCSHHRSLSNLYTSVSELRKKKNKKKNPSMTKAKKTATMSSILDRAPPPHLLRTVELNQLWAVPHLSDGLPRAYARVDVIHPIVSMVELTLLEPHPSSPYESLFAAANLPVAVGTYRLTSSKSLEPLSSLTNLVTPQATPESHPRIMGALF